MNDLTGLYDIMTESSSVEIDSISPDTAFRKSVGAIHTSGNLSLMQRRMTNVLICVAYEHLLKRREHSMPVSMLTNMLGWTGRGYKTDYLRENIKVLMQTIVEFNLRSDQGDSWQAMPVLSFAEIDANNVVTWQFSERLADRLYNPSVYANINLWVQVSLNSAYALNLYENCCRYVNVGSTGWIEIDDFRKLVGVDSDYYATSKRLVEKVINPSIERINENSDITVSIEYRKIKQVITGVRFNVEAKPGAVIIDLAYKSLGLSAPDTTLSVAEIKETEVFKRFLEHGVDVALAVNCVRQRGVAVAEAILEYTEDKNRQGKISSTPGAYIAAMIRSKANPAVKASGNILKELEADTKSAVMARRKNQYSELKEEYRRIQAAKARKELSREEFLRHVRKWKGGQETIALGYSYNEERDEYSDGAAKISFLINYLSRVMSIEVTQAGFNEWLRDSKGIDPAVFQGM